MTQEQAAILEPQTLLDEFKKNGVTHVVTIPDSETNYLYEPSGGSSPTSSFRLAHQAS